MTTKEAWEILQPTDWCWLPAKRLVELGDVSEDHLPEFRGAFVKRTDHEVWIDICSLRGKAPKIETEPIMTPEAKDAATWLYVRHQHLRKEYREKTDA